MIRRFRNLIIFNLNHYFILPLKLILPPFHLFIPLEHFSRLVTSGSQFLLSSTLRIELYPLFIIVSFPLSSKRVFIVYHLHYAPHIPFHLFSFQF